MCIITVLVFNIIPTVAVPAHSFKFNKHFNHFMPQRSLFFSFPLRHHFKNRPICFIYFYNHAQSLLGQERYLPHSWQCHNYDQKLPVCARICVLVCVCVCGQNKWRSKHQTLLCHLLCFSAPDAVADWLNSQLKTALRALLCEGAPGLYIIPELQKHGIGGEGVGALWLPTLVHQP